MQHDARRPVAAATYWLAALLGCLTLSALAQPGGQLWYKQPARQWVEALPLGNGRLGAMVFGGVEQELLQLNESTLWSGGPVKPNVNPGAAAVRQALRQDQDYGRADRLARQMQAFYAESHLPLGDVRLRQDLGGQTPTACYRDLDLATVTATTRFTVKVHLAGEPLG